MPEYLPLESYRQGLLPDDCGSCAWWQTAGSFLSAGPAAADRRNRWLVDVQETWGSAGLVACDTNPDYTHDSVELSVAGCVHFAPVSSLPRFRELPFPPVPPSSALLFCLRYHEDSAGWVRKRLISKALHELRRRGAADVYAAARLSGRSNSSAPACRFFSARLLTQTGFVEVARDGELCLMRVDSRGLLPLIDQAEAALRRLFAREHEPAPSPAAWLRGRNWLDEGIS